MYENIEKSKFFVRKKARPFFSASKSANFVLELFRHIILGQNEQIKKMAYIYGLGSRIQKVRKILKFHVFPPFWGVKGGNSPKWSLIIFL